MGGGSLIMARQSRFILPDISGIPDGMFDMSRISPVDLRPEPCGDLELDMVVGLHGLESKDAQPIQAGFTISTPAGQLPVGLDLDEDERRIVARCRETADARKAWYTMLHAVDADPRHPPAWATTVSSVIADMWQRTGRGLPELHTRVWAAQLMEDEPILAGHDDAERRMRMVSGYGEIPDLFVPEHDRIAISGCIGGSRLRLRIVADRWCIVDSAKTLLQIDDVEKAPARVLASRVGRPLSETVAVGSIPILAGRDPIVHGIRHHDGGIYILIGSDAVPMGQAPRIALEAVGLDRPVSKGACPWFVAARRTRA